MEGRGRVEEGRGGGWGEVFLSPTWVKASAYAVRFLVHFIVAFLACV